MDTKCNEPGCEQEGIPCTEPSNWGRREGLRDLKLLFKRRDWRALACGVRGWLRWGMVDVITYYCPSHCYENGFCYMCGQFWSGADECFDFGASHLCSNCQREDEWNYQDDWDGYWDRPEEEDDDDEWDSIIIYGPNAT